MPPTVATQSSHLTQNVLKVFSLADAPLVDGPSAGYRAA